MAGWGWEREEKREKKKRDLELIALCVNLYSGIGNRRKSRGTSFVAQLGKRCGLAVRR